jgi:hypothetical protein
VRQNQEQFLVEIGPGWHALFNWVFHAAQAEPAAVIRAVYPENDELQIIIAGGSQTLQKMVDEARHRSMFTCQYCGASIRRHAGFCDPHLNNGPALLKDFRQANASMERV